MKTRQLRKPWEDELEKVFATNALGRMKLNDVGLQYHNHRLVWNEIIKKEHKEEYTSIEGADVDKLLARVKELAQR